MPPAVIVHVKLSDPKIFDWLLSDPVRPQESERQLFMRIYCKERMGIWMLVKDCFVR